MAEPFPLFGDGDPNAPWQKTPLGLNYFANGFDVRPHKAKRAIKRLNRAIRWLQSQNCPESLLREFEQYYSELPDKLPDWIDTAYTFIHDTRWMPCFGKYPRLASIKPSDIRVQITALPIWVPQVGKYTAGRTDMDTGMISMCVAAVSAGTPGDLTTLNWLRKVGDLSRYEIGNWGAHFILRLDPKVREVGDGAIC